jgi:hypothetical protein
MRLSGLEPMIYTPDPKAPRTTFLNVGERCNVAGSMLYKKAIVDGDYDKAHAIALKQVTCGGNSSLKKAAIRCRSSLFPRLGVYAQMHSHLSAVHISFAKRRSFCAWC